MSHNFPKWLYPFLCTPAIYNSLLLFFTFVNTWYCLVVFFCGHRVWLYTSIAFEVWICIPQMLKESRHFYIWISFICICCLVKLSFSHSVWLCDSIDCSMPDFPVLHYPGVCSNSSLSQWCHPTISPSVTTLSSCPQPFPSLGSFPVSQLFTSGGQNIGASASASVLPTNIQGWCPLGLTGLILLSAGLSKVFSNTTVWKHQFFGAQLSL